MGRMGVRGRSLVVSTFLLCLLTLCFLPLFLSRLYSFFCGPWTAKRRRTDIGRVVVPVCVCPYVSRPETSSSFFDF